MLVTLPLGDRFEIYGGPGVGYYFFDGEYRIDQGPWETLVDIDMDDDVGYYALLGIRAELARYAHLFFESKYAWVESSLELRDDVRERFGWPDLQADIDFSGLTFNAGLRFTF